METIEISLDAGEGYVVGTEPLTVRIAELRRPFLPISRPIPRGTRTPEPPGDGVVRSGSMDLLSDKPLFSTGPLFDDDDSLHGDIPLGVARRM